MQERNAERFEMLTAFKDGNISTLGREKVSVRKCPSAMSLLLDMLQALDYLIYNKTVHRNIKSEKILYTKHSVVNSTVGFRGFGVCNFAYDARTFMESHMTKHTEDKKCLFFQDGSTSSSGEDAANTIAREP